jgi:hypothetical protein
MDIFRLVLLKLSKSLLVSFILPYFLCYVWLFFTIKDVLLQEKLLMPGFRNVFMFLSAAVKSLIYFLSSDLSEEATPCYCYLCVADLGEDSLIRYLGELVICFLLIGLLSLIPSLSGFVAILSQILLIISLINTYSTFSMVLAISSKCNSLYSYFRI